MNENKIKYWRFFSILSSIVYIILINVFVPVSQPDRILSIASAILVLIMYGMWFYHYHKEINGLK